MQARGRSPGAGSLSPLRWVCLLSCLLPLAAWAQEEAPPPTATEEVSPPPATEPEGLEEVPLLEPGAPQQPGGEVELDERSDPFDLASSDPYERSRPIDLSAALGPGELGRGIRLSRFLRLHPYVRHTLSWTDNVRRQSGGGGQEDIELRTIAGAVLRLNRRRVRTSLDYALSHIDYLESDSLDTIEHRLSLRGTFVFHRRLTGTAGAEVSLLSLPTNANQSGNVDRLVNAFNVGLTWQFHRRTRVSLSGNSSLQHFLDKGLGATDLLTYGTNVTIYHSLDLGFDLLAGAGYRELLYIDREAFNDDLGLNSVFGGAAMPLRSGRLHGEVRVGYEWSEVLRSRGARGDNLPGGVTVSVDVAWKFQRDTLVGVRGSRRIDFATGLGSRRITTFTAFAQHRITPRLSSFGSVTYDHQEAELLPDLHSTTYTLGLTFSPTAWLELGLQGNYFQSQTRVLGTTEQLRLSASISLKR